MIHLCIVLYTYWTSLLVCSWPQVSTDWGVPSAPWTHSSTSRHRSAHRSCGLEQHSSWTGAEFNQPVSSVSQGLEAYSVGRDYNTVDGRRFWNANALSTVANCDEVSMFWSTSAPLTGPSKQQAYLKSKFVSNYYTNRNTNPKTFPTLTWTLTDRHDGRRL